METNELNEILRKHKMWLNNEDGGVRANLSNADLSNADLSNTNLRNAVLDHANLGFTKLCYANLVDASLDDANLNHANLYYASLDHANLNHANLDFSCLPLWCGSLSANFDSRQLKQIAYHLVKAGLQSKNATKEDKTELRKLIEYANKFHRAHECGEIKEEAEMGQA